VTARYYRGPDEPGGSHEIIAEVVDGMLRRRIEWEGMSATCVGYDEYPISLGPEDIDAISDYVWEISCEEFETEWRRHCGSG
jgi:hypothetical protein